MGSRLSHEQPAVRAHQLHRSRDLEITRVFNVIAWVNTFTKGDAFRPFTPSTDVIVKDVCVEITGGPNTLCLMLELESGHLFVALEVHDERVMDDIHIATVTESSLTPKFQVPTVRELTEHLYANPFAVERA